MAHIVVLGAETAAGARHPCRHRLIVCGQHLATQRLRACAM